MSKAILSKTRPARIGLMPLTILCLGLFIQWDRRRLNADFNNVLSLLKNVWIDAGVNDKKLIVKFDRDNIKVTYGDSGQLFSALSVPPPLHNVNYDITLGKNMIVYTGVGTSGHNIKEHGGDLTLRSWSGSKKYIAVNCNGMVTKGRYPD